MICCLVGALVAAHFVANWRKFFSRLGFKHEDIDGEYDWGTEQPRPYSESPPAQA
jgi:hypothetical protein